MGGAKRTLVLERKGVRIGIMALVEPDWIETLAHPPSGLSYEPFLDVGRQLVDELRNKQVQIDQTNNNPGRQAWGQWERENEEKCTQAFCFFLGCPFLLETRAFNSVSFA